MIDFLPILEYFSNMREFSHSATDALRDAGEELREQAAVSADERRLSAATTKILRETGAMRLIQPARYGGLEADPRCFVEAMMAAGEYDGAAGWVLGVVGVHNWHIGLYADSVQKEVWGEDPDTWISSSYNYVGRATRVEGGFELSGRWGSVGLRACAVGLRRRGCIRRRSALGDAPFSAPSP